MTAPESPSCTTAFVSAASFVSAVLAVKVFADALWPYRWVTAAFPVCLVGLTSLVVLSAQFVLPVICPRGAQQLSHADIRRGLRAYTGAALFTGLLDAATALLALGSLASVPANLALIALAAPDAARALGSLMSAYVAAERESRRLPAAILSSHALVPGSVILALAVLVAAACNARAVQGLFPGGVWEDLRDGAADSGVLCRTLMLVRDPGPQSSLTYAAAPCAATQTAALATAALMLSGAVVTRVMSQVRNAGRVYAIGP